MQLVRTCHFTRSKKTTQHGFVSGPFRVSHGWEPVRRGEVHRRLGAAPDVPNGGAGPRLSAGSLRGLAGGPLVQRPYIFVSTSITIIDSIM